MTPQYFRRGEPITADKLNALVDGVLANRLQPGKGYVVTNTSRGTSLNITTGGGGGVSAAVLCPFQVTTANEGNDWKFKVEWGLIGGKIPTGMFPGGDPPLIMPWEDGWVCAYVTFVTDRVTVDTVDIVSGNTDIPENTVDGAYYPLAYLHTDSTNPENPVQVIDNMCTQPVPSVCDLVFSPPA